MKRQRGIALITAVILVALATVLATAIGFNSALAARRSANVFGIEQAMAVAEGAEAIAAYALSQNSSTTRTDSPDQDWAQPYGPTEIEHGVTLEASLEDQQGKFNINNLVTNTGVKDETAIEEFQRLLTSLSLDTKWATLMADWLDTDTEVTSPDGAEDSTYTALTPPYRTANTPVTSISELMALPGFGRDNYQRLAPYLSALPPGTAVNVCTASGYVLDAMTPGKQEFAALGDQLSARRSSGCFPTLAEFEATMTQDQYSKLNGRVAERSSYFRLRSWITIGSARFTLYSLVHREGSGQMRPVIRTFGTE